MVLGPRVAFAFTVAAATATGLGVLGASGCYDVDALRGGVRPGSTRDAGGPDSAPLPGDGGDEDAGFCATIASAFCDDFDEPLEVPLEDRWKGFAGVFPSTFIKGNATISRGTGKTTPLSRPYGLDVTLDARSGNRATAMLTQSLGRRTARAIELSVAIHAPTITSDAPRKVDDAGTRVMPRVTILGLGTVAATDTVGASLVLRPDSLAVQSGIQSTTLTPTSFAYVAASFDYLSVLAGTWLVLHLLVGDKDAVTAQVTAGSGVDPQCPASATVVAAAWGSLPFSRSACIEMPANLVPFTERDVGIVVGPSADDAAFVEISYDNVVAKEIP